jgi:serine/threonine-protein kinase
MDASTLLNNRYRVLHVLGEGGFGETFLAEDTHLPSKRRCVIKQLKPAMLLNTPIVQELFEREAAILEALGENNPQIPRLFAYFAEAERFYLVQEHIDGQNLRQKLKKQGSFSEAEVKRLLISLLPVVAFIHNQRIIHRDIKPDNIMLRTEDQQPVLIDFGVVKEVMGTVINSQGNLTQTMVVGSPGYMSPEQAAGRPTFASDLFSLGLTAIQLLTNQDPQRMVDLRTGDIDWHPYAPQVSPTLKRILDRAISTQAAGRYLAAEEMLADMQKAEGVASSGQTPTVIEPVVSQTDETVIPLFSPPPISRPPIAFSPPPIISLRPSTPAPAAPAPQDVQSTNILDDSAVQPAYSPLPPHPAPQQLAPDSWGTASAESRSSSRQDAGRKDPVGSAQSGVVLGRSFWQQWVVANALGFPLGLISSGFGWGLLQRMALQRSGLRVSWWWVWGTMLAYLPSYAILGVFFVGVESAAQVQTLSEDEYNILLGTATIAGFMIQAGLVGFTQSLVLQKRLRRSWLWIIGTLVATFAAFFLGSISLGLLGLVFVNEILWLLFFVILGAFYGIGSGVVLIWLSRHRAG